MTGVTFFKICGKMLPSSPLSHVQFSSVECIQVVVQPSPPSPSKRFSSSQTETRNPLNNHSSSLLATTTQLPVSMNVTTLGPPQKRNHTLSALLSLPYFTSCNVIKAQPCCSRCQNFLLFHARIAFQHTRMSHSAYPLICGWTQIVFTFDYCD